MAVINIRNATVLIRGGTFGQFVAVKIGEGNITYDEKRNITYVKDRGIIDTVREGEDDPMDVRLDATWEHITAQSGGLVPTVEDAFKQRGPASTWISSSSDLCEPYSVDIVIKDVPTCGAEQPETIILPDFRYESINHDLKAGTLSFSGKCNAKEAIVTRGAVQSY